MTDDLIKKVQAGAISKEDAMSQFAELSHEIVRTHHREFEPRPQAARIEQLNQARARRAYCRQLRVPFITPDFLKDFYLSQGLVLALGVSGQGKSTLAANIIAGFLQATAHEKKQAYVITNEENPDAVLDRVACCLRRQSFQDFYKDHLPPETAQTILDVAESLTEDIEVVDDGEWDMTCLEDVQAVLESAKKEPNVGLVIVDYLQTVTWSRNYPEMEAHMVSKELGFYLKDYGKKARVPVVVFAQLKPKSESPDIMTRIQNDRTIYNHAYQVIEIIPDFDTQETKFKIHKDRFGSHGNWEVTTKFRGGRYTMGGVEI